MKLLTKLNNIVFKKIIYHKRQITTYLTGKSTVTSNKGNKYIFVLYEYNSNVILIRPKKLISDIKFILVLKDLHDHLLTRRLTPAYIRLENGSPTAFQR